MARKSKPGYWVQGQFVERGSEEDLALQAEHQGSKTERKRESAQLQALGEALLNLKPAQLEVLELPETLKLALQEMHSIKAFEAQRRQRQWIGKLMRRVDPEPIEAALAAASQSSAESRARLHALENWRDRLLADDATLSDWLVQYPNTDSQQLRSLIRQAREDQRQATAPGKATRQAKAFRQLFLYLSEQID